MKKFIKNLLKDNKLLYSLYYYVVSFFLQLLGLFIKTDNNLALFVCYGGKKYDDSTKVLYEYITKKPEYSNIKCIWAFIEPDKYSLPEHQKIKIDTFQYYKTALKSKYWITNSSVTRGLNFKKKSTKYIVFQHGTLGIKKLGKDMAKDNQSFKMKKPEKYDMFIIQGKKEKEFLKHALDLKEEIIFEDGLPRNDELVNVSQERVTECKRKIGIPEGKKVILYTPTFREFYKDKTLNSIIDSPFDFEKMEDRLKEEYVFVFTAHYEVANILNIPNDNKFVINAFQYPYINDLLIAADILISDYSSVIFDYAILEKPILCFAYDYDKYMEERGTYLNLNELFYDGVIKTQEQLIDIIENMDYIKECEHSKKMKEEYINKCGNTVSEIAKKIFER